MSNEGTSVTNAAAESTTHSGYEICQISGKKAFPGELVRDPYSKLWVLPQYADVQPREGMRYRTRKYANGARFPEQDLNTITTVSRDDL